MANGLTREDAHFGTEGDKRDKLPLGADEASRARHAAIVGLHYLKDGKDPHGQQACCHRVALLP